MDIAQINPNFAGGLGGIDNLLPPEVEGQLANLLNAFAGGDIGRGIQELYRQLPSDQQELLKAKLNDPNDEFRQMLEGQMSPVDFQDLLGAINGDQLAAQAPDTIHALAVRGNEDAIELDAGTTFTIDQWNHFRANGNPPDVPAMDPVSSTQTDAMIAASGLDRDKPMSVKDYLDLLNKTTTMPAIDPTKPQNASISPDTVHARAARGDAGAIDMDSNTVFTIDQWNHFRANGNSTDESPRDPVSNSQTDAMIAASGLDRNTAMSVKDYLALFERTAEPQVVIDPVLVDPAFADAAGQSGVDDFAARIFAAQMKRDN
jgi:hypothetical protein